MAPRFYKNHKGGTHKLHDRQNFAFIVEADRNTDTQRMRRLFSESLYRYILNLN